MERLIYLCYFNGLIHEGEGGEGGGAQGANEETFRLKYADAVKN